MVTGLDLVEWQLRVASGEKLPRRQDQIELCGHAIEARICAEDPARDFRPETGPILDWQVPLGPGLRLDAGIETGSAIGSHYESLLGKLIASGADRAEALARLTPALEQTHLAGIASNLDLLARASAHAEFRAGRRTLACDRQAAAAAGDEVRAVPQRREVGGLRRGGGLRDGDLVRPGRAEAERRVQAQLVLAADEAAPGRFDGDHAQVADGPGARLLGPRGPSGVAEEHRAGIADRHEDGAGEGDAAQVRRRTAGAGVPLHPVGADSDAAVLADRDEVPAAVGDAPQPIGEADGLACPVGAGVARVDRRVVTNRDELRGRGRDALQPIRRAEVQKVEGLRLVGPQDEARLADGHHPGAEETHAAQRLQGAGVVRRPGRQVRAGVALPVVGDLDVAPIDVERDAGDVVAVGRRVRPMPAERSGRGGEREQERDERGGQAVHAMNIP